MATALRELIVAVSVDSGRYQREMERVSRMGASYGKTMRQAGNEAAGGWDRNTAAARTHAGALEASTQAIGRYAAVAASAFGASRLIGLADEYGQISSRIRLATESTADFENAQSRLVDIASRTYRQYGEAADQFTATAVAMREMGFATNDTLDAAEALGLALVAGGANVQRGAAANDAWAKSMVQGRIATDQFQTLLLQTPRVVQALGDGLGKTTQELQAMAKSGELTARVVVPAITSQIGKLSAEVESMPTTVEDAGIRFRNELQRWVGEANASAGATQVLVRGMELLADNIDELVTVGGAAALAGLAGKMIQLGHAASAAAVGMVQSRVAAAAEALAIRDATLASQLKAQADLRRAQAAMGAVRGTAASATASRNYAAALLAERQATLAAAQAQVAYTRATNFTAQAGRAALGVLGGPAGLAITVGMVAAGWLLFRDNTDAAESALANWTGTAAEAVAKFKELNAEARAGALLELGRDLKTAEGEVQAALDRLLTAPKGTIGGAAWAETREGIAQLRREFAAGAIDADTLSARAAALSREMLENAGASGRLGDTYTELLSTLAGAARAADEKRGTLQTLNTVNGEAERQANATAGAIAGQASALDVLGAAAESAGKRIQSGLLSLPGQIERLGKGAGQAAQLDVRDWIMGETLEKGITSQEDPRYLQMVKEGERYVAMVTEQAAKQEALAASTKKLTTTRKELAEVSASDDHLIRMNEGYAEQVQSLERQIALHGDVGRAAAMAYDLANGSLSGLAEDQKAYLQELAEWLDWMDDVAALEGVWADVAKGVSETKDGTDRMTEYARQAARNMQTSFADFLFDPFAEGTRGMGEAFSATLRRIMAEAASAEIFNLIGTWASGYTGAGSGWINAIGGAIQTDGKRAGGGRVEPFGAYDVTEHGDPELLQYGGRQVLLMGAQGGMVSPLMQAKGGGAAGGGTQVQISIEHKGEPMKVKSATAEQKTDGTVLVRMITAIQRQNFGNGSMDDIMGQFGVRRQGMR